MQFKKYGLFFYSLLVSFQLFSQINTQNIQFRSPVDFPIYLAGNFGEIRSGHFHAGIDIKTQGVEGKKIHAVEQGYISRIKVSANSYGKTIYINHPNGYTTVYGHLSRYNSEIEKIVKDIQYQNTEFEINYFPKPNELPVSKGEVIGFSGNTGSSSGPHLHFEVRETNNQIPVNPLFFNFEIEDKIAPVFYNLVLYPVGKNSTINGLHKYLMYKLKSNSSVYSLIDTNKISLSGEIGIGVEIYDYLNGSRNRCGIYELSVFIDSSMIYDHKIDKFSFNETAYVESHIDFAEKNKSNKTIQKTFVAPNNKLRIYKTLINHGRYSFSKDTIYQIQILAIDAYKNRSELSFKVSGKEPDLPLPEVRKDSNGVLMNWDKENVFESDEIKINIPANCLFDTLLFKYSKSNPDFRAFSNIHHIYNVDTPILKKYSVKIKTFDVPSELKKKVFIAQLLENKKIKYFGGDILNEYMVGELNSFGDFVVLLDTIAPNIKPLIKNESLLQKDNSIKFTITDSLSGIKSYNGFIDNKWALFEYDLKNDLLFYSIDNERLEKNIEHEIELFVMDNNGNVSTYYNTFYW